jgi:hypothetical protein
MQATVNAAGMGSPNAENPSPDRAALLSRLLCPVLSKRNYAFSMIWS